MKLSIIIPSFNSMATIKRAIESCIVVELKDVEIIIVDDGSTDPTVSFLKNEFDYLIKREILKIIQNHHKGAGAARNTGLQKAQGRWIIFLDADDEFVDLNFILKLLISRQKQFSIYNFFYSKKEKLNSKIVINGEHYIKENLGLCKYTQWNSRPSHKIFSRKFLKENDIFFPTNVKIGEDLVFNLKCLMLNPLIISENHLVYKVHENNQSITHVIIHQDIYNDAVSLVDIVLRLSLSEKIKNEFIAKSFSMMVVRYLKSQYNVNHTIQFIEKFKIRYKMSCKRIALAFWGIRNILGYINTLFSFCVWQDPIILKIFFNFIREKKYRK